MTGEPEVIPADLTEVVVLFAVDLEEPLHRKKSGLSQEVQEILRGLVGIAGTVPT